MANKKQRKNTQIKKSGTTGKILAGKPPVSKQKSKTTRVAVQSGSGKEQKVADLRKARISSKAPKKHFRYQLLTSAGPKLKSLDGGLKRQLHKLAILMRLRRASLVEEQTVKKHAARQGTRTTEATSQGQPTGKTTRTIVGRLSKWGQDRQGHGKAVVRRSLNIEGIVALLLAILLFYPPYFRGLFFAKELLPTHIYTAVIFAIFAFYQYSKGRLAFFRRPLDYAVFILLGLYLTSSIIAWDASGAVAAILKMTNYVAVYWLLAYSVRSLQGVTNYLAVFFTSGVGVGLLGLGAAFGTFHYKDAFLQGRIYSSLQYPNTLAAFLTAINLFGLYLWASAKKDVTKLLLAAGNYILFLTILGTGSRGGFVIYPVGLLILLLGLPGKERWRALSLFFVQAAAALMVYSSVMDSTGGHAQLAGWLWTLTGLVITVGVQFVWTWLENESAAKKLAASAAPRILVVSVMIAVLVALFAAGGYMINRNHANNTSAIGSKTAKQATTQSLGSRLASISTNERDAKERLVWDRDAFRIMTANPVNALLGTGGGGWNANYHQYQDYLYFTTEVHDHFLQVGVETGFSGLLAFLAIWCCFTASTWQTWLRCRKGTKASAASTLAVKLIPYNSVQGTSWAVFASGLTLGMHSLIDFNLSLGAVAIFLWAMFGLQRGLERLYGTEGAALGQEAAKVKKARKGGNDWMTGVCPILVPVLLIVITIVYFFVPLSLIISQQHAMAADAAMKQNNSQQLQAELQSAANSDPWNTSYRATLARMMLYQGQTNKDNSQFVAAEDTVATAVRMHRGDAQLHLLYARIMFNNGKITAALQQIEEAVRLMPFDQGLYDNLAIGYNTAGRFALAQGAGDLTSPKEQGKVFLQRTMAIPQRIEQLMASVPPAHMKLWSVGQKLVVSPNLYLQAGEAAVLLNRPEAGQYLVQATKDPNLKAEVLLWQGLALERKQQGSGATMIKQALTQKPTLQQESAQAAAIIGKK